MLLHNQSGRLACRRQAASAAYTNVSHLSGFISGEGSSPRHPSRPVQTLPAMANAVQTLPRFLLPRISWTAPVGKTLATASVGATQAGSQRPWQTPIRRFRTDGSSPRCNVDSAAPNPSSILRQPGIRRAFHASAPQRRDHHFDTLKFVQKLQSDGFTEHQSVAMMKVLNDVIQERSAQPRFHTISPDHSTAR